MPPHIGEMEAPNLQPCHLSVFTWPAHPEISVHAHGRIHSIPDGSDEYAFS